MNAPYKAQVTPWQVREEDFPHTGSGPEQLEFLVRYAVLAPSSHNTQPWQFAIGQDEVRLLADQSRRLEVADADRRELYLSLGCALENLLIAAEHFDYGHQVAYCPDPDDDDLAAVVKFWPAEESSPFRPASLFEAIPARHTNHQVYEAGRPIPEPDVVPQHTFRLGYAGPEKEHTPRRPVAEVLV